MFSTAPRQYPVVLPFLRVFILTGLFLIAGCKKDSHSEAVEKQRQRVDSLMRASMENQKKLETEEELAERIRRISNKNLKSTDTVYYQANVIQLPDSLMYAVNLLGKVNQNGKIRSFTKTMVTYDGLLAEGELQGIYFRMDNPGKDRYILYSLDTIASQVNAYTLDTSESELTLLPMSPETNYYFNLLSQTEFHYDLDREERFFKTIKSLKVSGDSILESLLPKRILYRDPNELLPKDLTPPFRLYWSRSDNDIRNILLSRPTDSSVNMITLRGKTRGILAETLIHSRFENDSVFSQFVIRDSLILDQPHLVVYQRDSVTNTFSYDRTFTFTLSGTDTISTLLKYPQRYSSLADSIFEVTTSSFNMNNKKAYWRYTIAYEKDQDQEGGVRIRIYQRDLIDEARQWLIFRLPQYGTPLKSTLQDILYPDTLFQGQDLNFDGSDDLSFQKGTDNNGNPNFAVYLYDPGSGRFVRTPQLDGVSAENSIITDSTKHRLLYPGYIGNGQMSVSIIYPEEDTRGNKEIYWTSGDTDAPRVNYQKIRNNTVIEKQSPLLDSLPVRDNDLKKALINWILQRDTP